MSSTDASKKRASCSAERSTTSLRYKIGALGRDANGTIVGVAGTHAQTTDGLKRRIRDRDRIRAKRHDLGEIRCRA